MSAIGSVIVMAFSALSPLRFRTRVSGRPVAIVGGGLPGALGHAGQLAGVRHLPQADAAQPELAVDGLGPAATLAAGVAAHRELGLASGLDLQSSLRHQLFSLNGNPSFFSSARPSSSLVADVTTVMSMPRERSILSWLISWNMTCSVSPKV